MKQQIGNYTKTPIALALASMLSILASGAQAQNAATEGLSAGQLDFVAAETAKNTVYQDVSAALEKIENTTKAARTAAATANPEQPLGVLISLSQQGTENEIDITTTDSTLVINSVGEYLQDSSNGDGGNTFTANISASGNNQGTDGTSAGGNVVYLSQKGNSVFTLNIIGDSNQVMLSEFGGQDGLEAAVVNIYSSNNEVEIYRQGAAASGAADELDLNIAESSSGNVVVLGYDAFSTIVGKINSGSSYVSVVQNQDGQTLPEGSTLDDGFKNNVTFTIDKAESGSGFFDLRQLGIGNQLTLVANGSNNDIRINQSNTAATTEGTVDGINKMTLNVDQDNSTIDISQAGPSTSVISLTGDGNAISVQNSRIGDSINPTVTNVSLTNTGLSGNSVTLRDYQRVGTAGDPLTGVIVNGEGNILETTGDIGTFNVSGDRNDFSVINSRESSEGSGQVDMDINGSDNRSIGDLKHYGIINDRVKAHYKIIGDRNTLATNFFDIMARVDVTIDNSAASAPQGNKVDLEASGFDSFELQITGDQNDYTFRGDVRLYSMSNVSSTIKGDNNNQFFDLMSPSRNGLYISTSITGSGNNQTFNRDDAATQDEWNRINTSIQGWGNSWDYTVGNSGFEHTILGDNFHGTVDYNTMSGGYKQSFSQLGTGSSEFTSQAGTVKISTQGPT